MPEHIRLVGISTSCQAYSLVIQDQDIIRSETDLDRLVLRRRASAMPSVLDDKDCAYSHEAHLQQFLERAPIRCIELIAKYLDFTSFTNVFSANSSLLRLSYSSTLQPCWTHFALVQRILRHGENVLIPSLDVEPVQLVASNIRNKGYGGGRRGLAYEIGAKVSPSQTFCRRLPRVTRHDFVRAGSLNLNWRQQNFVSEHRGVLICPESLDRVFVLPADPLACTSSRYSVSPDSQLSVQVCSSPSTPSCLQVLGSSHLEEDALFLTILGSKRVIVTHVTATYMKGPREAKLPQLPASVTLDPSPLLKTKCYLGKGKEFVGATSKPVFKGLPVEVDNLESKRSSKHHRHQQAHHLLSWVHIGAHPLRPARLISHQSPDRASGDAPRGAVNQTFINMGNASSLHCPRHLLQSDDSSHGHCADASSTSVGIGGYEDNNIRGIALCPAVRLLCLCMQPIAVAQGCLTESIRSVHGFPQQHNPDVVFQSIASPVGKRDGSRDEPVLNGEFGEQRYNTDLLEYPSSHGMFSSHNEDCVASETDIYRSVNVNNSEGCTETAGPHRDSSEYIFRSQTTSDVSHLLSESSTKPEQMRIWPIALCTYLNEGARFVPHAVVCCALSPDEVLKSARARLWFRARKDMDFIGDATQPSGSSVQPSLNSRAAKSTTRAKAVSLSLNQHPDAIFVGMVAVGTSQGRIFCTPPPRCLYRRCFCGRGCPHPVPSLKLSTPQGANHTTVGSGAWKVSNIPGTPLQHDSPNAGSIDLERIAAKAGNEVIFQRVGEFPDDASAVDFLEIVWGTPWASEKFKPSSESSHFSHVHGRTSAWHWTRQPQSQSSYNQRTSSGDECESPCGGIEAEALWIIACSKQSGIKIFRFLWGCPQFSEKSEPRLAQSYTDSYGEWRCVFTIRGQCEMVSMDLPSGIFAVCTPVDSRVYFLCFKHLLPENIFYPVEYSLKHKEMSTDGGWEFSVYDYPKPQQVPAGGYVCREQQCLLPWFQVPQECSWHELLVPRRPSYLVPLGGRRWVIIVGAVIRVVKITTSESPKKKTHHCRRLKEIAASEQRSVLSHSTNSNADVALSKWFQAAPEAPDLSVLRLCVFSHSRDIYQCAFDGVRRMVTIDLNETLVVWDMQKHIKLFGLELTKPLRSGRFETLSGISRDRRRDHGRLSQHDVSDVTGDTSDDICSDQDTLGTVWSTKHDRYQNSSMSGDTNGKPCKPYSIRHSKKGVKSSVKKQCSSGWMHMQVRALHRAANVPVASHTTVGGMRFSQSTLESALQLQLLYDCQRDSCDKRMPSVERRNSSEECVPSAQTGCNSPPKERASVSDESPLSCGKIEGNKSEEPFETLVKYSYADNFPSLGSLERSVHKVVSEAGHSDFKHGALDAGSTSVPNKNIEGDWLPSNPLHSSKSDLSPQQLRENISVSPNSKGTSERLSFAEVAAAAAASCSNNGKATQVGWALGPTKAATISDAIGEEAAQALLQISKSLGVAPEELLAQQLDEWSRYSRDSTPADSGAVRSQRDVGKQVAGTEESYIADPGPCEVVRDCRDKLSTHEFCHSAAKQCEHKTPHRGDHIGRTDVTEIITESLGQQLLEGQNNARVSKRYANPAICMRRDSQQGGSMAGLLGLQKSFFPLGPNSQHRHVSSVCLSETCLALLFKDLKTWQVWIFSPESSSTVSKKAEMSATLHEL